MELTLLESFNDGAVQDWFKANVIDPTVLQSFANHNPWSASFHLTSCGFKSRDENEKVAEYVFVQELIWSLINPVENKIISSRDGLFYLKDNVRVPGLICGVCGLQDFLNPINDVRVISSFIESTLFSKIDTTEGSADAWPVTYEAYSNFLLEYLINFNSQLEGAKQILRLNHGESVQAFFIEMKYHFKELQQLSKLHVRAVKGLEDRPNWYKAARLLSVLFDNCQNSYEPYKSLFYKLFISTFEPYCVIMEKWMQEGRLEDWREEFPIIKNLNVDVMDEEFWGQSYQVESLDELREELGFEPLEFLVPFISKLVEAGKSLDLMSNFEFAVEICSAKCNNLMLWDAIKATIMMPNAGLLLPVASLNRVLEDQEYTALDDDDFSNEYLKFAFKDEISQLMKIEEKPLLSYSPSELVSSSLLSSTTPKQDFMEAMYPIFSSWYKKVSSQLTSMFCDKFNIYDHIRNIHLVYLFEAGDVMRPFYGVMFEMMISGEPWNDLILLTDLLEDSLSVKYSDVGPLFTVSCGNDYSMDVLKSLKEIRINYKITWPNSIILNDDAMEKYQNIFTFLLQIKSVLYGVNRLSIKAPPKKSHKFRSRESYKYRRLLLLRQWLLFFLNSIHGYFMSRIFSAVDREAHKKLFNQNNLDSIIADHAQLLSSLHEKCLFRPELESIRLVLMKVLSISLTVHSIWSDDADNVEEESLYRLEVEYQRCHQFFLTILKDVQNRPSLSHLKGLCIELQSKPKYE